jgi:hypothetical protein
VPTCNDQEVKTRDFYTVESMRGCLLKAVSLCYNTDNNDVYKWISRISNSRNTAIIESIEEIGLHCFIKMSNEDLKRKLEKSPVVDKDAAFAFIVLMYSLLNGNIKDTKGVLNSLKETLTKHDIDILKYIPAVHIIEMWGSKTKNWTECLIIAISIVCSFENIEECIVFIKNLENPLIEIFASNMVNAIINHNDITSKATDNRALYYMCEALTSGDR